VIVASVAAALHVGGYVIAQGTHVIGAMLVGWGTLKRIVAWIGR
jgi:hypothetical protein